MAILGSLERWAQVFRSCYRILPAIQFARLVLHYVNGMPLLLAKLGSSVLEPDLKHTMVFFFFNFDY